MITSGTPAIYVAVQQGRFRSGAFVRLRAEADEFHQRSGSVACESTDLWSAEVKTLKMPVMLVYGDRDMYRPEHIVTFYQLLGGGLRDAGWMREHMSQNRLAILPDVTHYEAFMAPAMVRTVLPFLAGTSSPPSWAEQVEQGHRSRAELARPWDDVLRRAAAGGGREAAGSVVLGPQSERSEASSD